ncbi:MAG: tRNA (adenosine(37)-N6)-threonylcarbamoyltransferase complex ATPase subunit type 1 TsaE [Melioribacteraceae bacterium]|nr:tRNA (adenosine(37)-N6)-threonylcarbamoyltransferase complex ATPase subunit type 1 TsaE [Melioribacteraceae bacterium]
MKIPEFEIFSNCEAETKEAAAKLSEEIEEGDIFALTGDLGAGKTTFIKAVVKSIGIDDSNSPSFALVNVYRGRKKIYHFDFYRINKVEELYDIGFDEYISDESSVKFIEWAELFPEILPGQYYQIKFEYVNNSKRKITLKHVQN